MTQEEKQQIYQLRLDGGGYKAIAKVLHINRDTVKAYCKRHHLNGPTQLVEFNAKVMVEKEDLCKCCNTPITRKKKGRVRKFWKKVESSGGGEDITTESLMVHAISRGFILADFNEMSVGMILDYIARYDGIQGGKEEERIKSAGQSEFDGF